MGEGRGRRRAWWRYDENVYSTRRTFGNVSGESQGLAELAEQLTAPATEDRSTEDSVVERLQESLARRRVCAVAEIAAELGCSIPKLMADAAERPDMFGVLEGAQPVIFSVRQRGTMLIEP